MKGVIFDVDGTMVDNMMIHHRAWQKKLSEYGLDLTLEEVKAQIHGVNVEILERLFGDRFTPDERLRISNEKEAAYREIFAPDLQLLPGLQEFLNYLIANNCIMAVASAAPVENVEFVLNGLNLKSHFPVIQHAGTVKKGKPDPEIFLNAARELGISPLDVVIFEDSPTGALAGSRAGSEVVVLTTTHRPEEFSHIPGVVAYLEDYTDLPHLQSIVA